MKKRLLLYVLSTALLLAVFAGMAMPASAATGTLSVASVQAEPGDTITVDVSLVGAVAALQFDITYDPAVLTLVSIEKGSACPSGWTEATNITNGRFAVIGAIPLENVSINGAIARYTYTVNSGAALGESALELINIVISD